MAYGNHHFFRPLLPGFEHRLSIPVAFSKHLDGAEDAVLRSSGGKCYPVNISGMELKDEGWKEFVSEHGLQVGDFLFFRYNNAHKVFDVMTFDLSACEIQYLASSSSSPPLPFNASVSTAEHDEEALDNGPAHHKPKHQETDQIKEKGSNDSGPAHEESDQIKEKDGWSVPKHPFFVVTIRRYNLGKNRLLIPKVFARDNDLESMSCRSVILLNEEGRSWPASMHSYRRFCFGKYCHQVALRRGIDRFQEENRLKLGDSFNLELVQGGENPVFKMSGLHSNPMVIEEETEKERRKKMERKVKRERTCHGSSTTMHPYFLVKMTSTCLSRYLLYIPLEFTQRNGLTGLAQSMILRNEKGSSFLVGLKTMKGGRACIGSGWKELVQENGLMEGDVLMFELIETGTRPVMTFKVVLEEEIGLKEGWVK
ncbi:B3 domain-containing protein REM10 [Linum perenne]